MNTLLKNVLTLLITMPSFANSAQNPEFRVINGSYKVNNIVINENLKINGEAVLVDTHVNNTMIVNGKLVADHVNFESNLSSNGTIIISHAILKEYTYFSGEISSNNCHYLKNLYIRSKNTSFSQSQFNNIVIQKIPYIKSAQQIRLHNKSLVSGDITFESGNGEVYLDNSSKIMGQVYGGKTIYI